MQHTCRQAAEWISLRRDEPLGFWRAWMLRMHLRGCGDCRQVERQFDQLGSLAGTSRRGGPAPDADDDDASQR